MKGIAEWLAPIGLSEYAQRFADNGIDLSVIRDLTEQDLKDLGVLLGHRRRILRAIAELDGVAPAPTGTATELVARDEAERRHLTVMICDLVGSTALSTRLDPEDMHAVIDAYHAACARITRTYDGFLTEFRGDGILAYFGYPIAHEDDAERAVRAGLDIIAAIAQLETRAAEPLAVRIGIATGVVPISAALIFFRVRKRYRSISSIQVRQSISFARNAASIPIIKSDLILINTASMLLAYRA